MWTQLKFHKIIWMPHHFNFLTMLKICPCSIMPMGGNANTVALTLQKTGNEKRRTKKSKKEQNICKKATKYLHQSSRKYLSAYCPTLTKGSNSQTTQIWESDVFRLDLAYSTSIPSLKQKHSSCWKILKSRYNEIALMSIYMTDTFCSFTRNFIFKSCFCLSV